MLVDLSDNIGTSTNVLINSNTGMFKKLKISQNQTIVLVQRKYSIVHPITGYSSILFSSTDQSSHEGNT